MLQELVRKIRWGVLAGTFGNFHDVVIGLVVEAWNNMQNGHSALAGAPACEGLYSDAILVVDQTPNIVLEVEGNNCLQVIDKFGTYLHPDRNAQYGASGLCILYQYAVTGRGEARQFFFQDHEVALETLEQVFVRSRKVSDLGPFMLVTISKAYQRSNVLAPNIDLRRRNDWYQGVVSGVDGYLFENGQKVQEILWQPQG